MTMKLFELMRQIQDACNNDGNLEREVRLYDPSTKETFDLSLVNTNHPNEILFSFYEE